MNWEVVNDTAGERVRRHPVPGGWLYQVEFWMWTESNIEGSEAKSSTGWHTPVFVASKDVTP